MDHRSICNNISLDSIICILYPFYTLSNSRAEDCNFFLVSPMCIETKFQVNRMLYLNKWKWMISRKKTDISFPIFKEKTLGYGDCINIYWYFLLSIEVGHRRSQLLSMSSSSNIICFPYYYIKVDGEFMDIRLPNAYIFFN